MKSRVSALFLVLSMGMAAPQLSQGAVVFYTDAVSFNAASNTTLVEDFEAFLPKNTGLPSFVSNGNTYTGFAGTPSPNVYVANAGFTNFGVPITTSAVLTANGDEDFTVDFGSPSTAVGFDTYLNGLGLATVQVFGTSGLLGSFNPAHDPAIVGFLGITSSEPITSIRWTTVLGGRVNTGIDNIVQGRAVPEPTTLLLLGLGLAGLGYSSKRRSAQQLQ